MKDRPLDGPMKYESEFSTPSKSGEACTLKVSSLGACDSFLGSGEPDDGEADVAGVLRDA